MGEPASLVELVMVVSGRLDGGGVGHGFGGAIALAYFVREPRATRDMDINIAVPLERCREVLGLLPGGVDWDDRSVQRCLADGQVRVWFRHGSFEAPIDLFFPQHRFHDEVARQVSRKPFGRGGAFLLPVIAAAHLCVFKALFNRPKDWIDIAVMLDARTVDVAEATRWLVELVGSDHEVSLRFAEALAASAARPATPTVESGAMPEPVIDWRRLGE